VPLAASELRRGRICYAVYPFVPSFPLSVADDGGREEAGDVEAFARARRGRHTRILAEGRLRPVLLLHDGTRGEHEDVICLRVNAVKERHRRVAATWRRIEMQEHPFFFLLPAGRRGSGLARDSVISLSSVGAIHKTAILGPRPAGQLGRDEMRAISDRLSLVLSLDLAPKIAARAEELLRRAGLGQAPRPSGRA